MRGLFYDPCGVITICTLPLLVEIFTYHLYFLALFSLPILLHSFTYLLSQKLCHFFLHLRWFYNVCLFNKCNSYFYLHTNILSINLKRRLMCLFLSLLRCRTWNQVGNLWSRMRSSVDLLLGVVPNLIFGPILGHFWLFWVCYFWTWN